MAPGARGQTVDGKANNRVTQWVPGLAKAPDGHTPADAVESLLFFVAPLLPAPPATRENGAHQAQTSGPAKAQILVGAGGLGAPRAHRVTGGPAGSSV